MKRLALLLLFTAPLGAFAQDAEEAIAKLRDALRSTMVQLRDAQAQIANLQASEIAKDQEITKLKADLKKLADQAMEEKNAAANTISGLREQMDKKNASIAGYLRALEKWKQDFGQLTENYRKTAAERDKLKNQVLSLERTVAEQRRKNVEMHRVGLEILDRYEKFWFGDALAIREPFSGIARTRLQNLIQEKEDQLLAQRIVDTPAGASAPPPESGASAEPAASQAEPSPTPTSAPTPAPTPTPRAKPTSKPKPTPKPAPTPKPRRGETAWPKAEASR